MIRALAQAGQDREAAEIVRIVERTTGQTIPQEPFAAIITGYAETAETAANGESPPTEAEMADCFGGAGIFPEPDPITGFFFYARTLTPTKVERRRYRWRQLFGNLDSEGCGWILNAAETELVPWNQAWYGVNTAEITQDPRLDYPPVNLGTTVLMSFGQLSGIVADPAWGFFFHFMPDPKGILLCNRNTSLPIGCCTVAGIPPQYLCLDAVDCASIGGRFIGSNVPCPSTPC